MWSCRHLYPPRTDSRFWSQVPRPEDSPQSRAPLRLCSLREKRACYVKKAKTCPAKVRLPKLWDGQVCWLSQCQWVGEFLGRKCRVDSFVSCSSMRTVWTSGKSIYAKTYIRTSGSFLVIVGKFSASKEFLLTESSYSVPFTDMYM